jgi:hypothetical protein
LNLSIEPRKFVENIPQIVILQKKMAFGTLHNVVTLTPQDGKLEEV